MYNGEYGNLTLMPKNEYEGNLFKSARQSAVQTAFKQVCIFVTCFSFGTVIMTIVDPTMTNFN